VNYKAEGIHWVIDSGCTNHMTGERKIFSHLDEDISDFDNITFGDDSKGGAKALVKYLSIKIIISLMSC
jgi:hypothetical protein